MKTLRRFLCFSLLFTTWLVSAQSIVSHKLDGNTLALSTTQGDVQVQLLHDNAIEVSHGDKQSQFPSFAKEKGFQANSSAVRLVEKSDHLLFGSKTLVAKIYKSPLRIVYLKNGETLLEEELGHFAHSTVQGFRFKLSPGEKLLGGGERVVGMDRRGQRLPLYNRAHYGYTTESHQMNFSIPAVMSDKKYTVLFDNTASGWLDIGSSDPDVLQFEADGGRQAYIVFAGDDYPELIHSYVKVTGTQPLPPRWAFGNHASRFGYKSQQEVMDTIALYKEKDVPVDSVILDLYWFGPDIKGHMGNLDWDRNTFPEPEKMIKELSAAGVKTILITEPFVLTSSKRWEEAVAANVLATDLSLQKPKTFDFYFGNTGIIDVFKNEAHDWFGGIYKDLADQGVAGVWGDLGEPEVHPADSIHTLDEFGGRLASGDEVHNVYGHQWADLVEKTLSAAQPNVRPFIIMRAGFAGSQRFGMIPWTGDVSRSWDGLKPQTELSLQMSMLGMAYTHSDLGGFAGGEKFDKEMYIRWLQYGVFQPIYRPHAQDNIAPEPVFHDKETVDIVRDYIKLRYRLLPYNYTMAYENSKTGMPLMRPMFFDGQSSFDIKDQFMWGDSFLVKPVTDPGLKSIDVLLPEGQWFDYFSGTQYQGGQTISYPLDLQVIPVLVKAGAIIPTTKALDNLDKFNGSTLQLDYYYSKSVAQSAQSIYEDDGISSDAMATKAFDLIQTNAAVKGDVLEFSIELDDEGKGYKGSPKKRDVTLVVHNWQQTPKQVSINGKNLTASQMTYDSLLKQLVIRFAWQGKPQQLKIK